jgi:predicted metal-dependent peptidase
LRRKERNRHDWDLACDLAINDLIPAMPATAPRADYLNLPPLLAAEEYYRLLVDPWDMGSLAGSGDGDADRDDRGRDGEGDGTADGGTAADHRPERLPLDDHRIWEEADSTPLRLAEELVRGMVRDAVQRCDGEVPAEIRPLVAGLLAPPRLPWKMILRQFVATAGRIGRSSTWQRENRRFGQTTPGTRKQHRLHLLVGVDVSDSTNAPELREAFAAELLRIARGRETLITVVYATSRIQRIDSFRGSACTMESYHGGGFTDLRPVFDHARTLHPRPAAVIYLTDGIGPAPETMEFPTLWVLTREGERPVPWGVELRLDI